MDILKYIGLVNHLNPRLELFCLKAINSLKSNFLAFIRSRYYIFPILTLGTYIYFFQLVQETKKKAIRGIPGRINYFSFLYY